MQILQKGGSFPGRMFLAQKRGRANGRRAGQALHQQRRGARARQWTCQQQQQQQPQQQQQQQYNPFAHYAQSESQGGGGVGAIWSRQPWEQTQGAQNFYNEHLNY